MGSRSRSDRWGRCHYCQYAGSLTKDHVIPRSKAPKGLPGNVVDACFGCNKRKADMSETEFLAWFRTPEGKHYLDNRAAGEAGESGPRPRRTCWSCFGTVTRTWRGRYTTLGFLYTCDRCWKDKALRAEVEALAA